MSAQEPITAEKLLANFQSYGRPSDQWLVGSEFERHLLWSDGTPIPYFGEVGVEALLNAFISEGWDPYYEGEHPIALFKNGANITLEPGGQFELSGAPYADLQPIHDESVQFIKDIDRLVAGKGVHQSALGFTPKAAIKDIGWVPKGRYVIMREHLGKTGKLAHHMMKGTCAVQASYDFADEAGAAAKVQLATRLGPLTTAMFANSPYKHGVDCGMASWRGHAWTQTDPRRTGFPEAAVAFTFERWLDYLLDTPMMFFKDAGGNWLAAEGRTFREWMADTDAPPTEEDWDLHMTSVFPEVRIKKQIEVRGADCVSQDLAMAFTALFKGLFYCSKALSDATELSLRLATSGSRDERFSEACRGGLKGVVGGRTYASWAEELITVADDALERCAPDDRKWLVPLQAQIALGESPAHTLLRTLGDTPNMDALLRATHPLCPTVK